MLGSLIDTIGSGMEAGAFNLLNFVAPSGTAIQVAANNKAQVISNNFLDDLLNEPSATTFLGPQINSLVPPVPQLNSDGGLANPNYVPQPIPGLQVAVQTGMNNAANYLDSSTYSSVSSVASDVSNAAGSFVSAISDSSGLNILGLGLTALAIIVGIQIVKAIV